MKVWKFEIPIADEFMFPMPGGARILDVQMQHGLPQMWALIEEGVELETRRFRLLGTDGLDVYPSPGYELIHIGTFQHEPAFVFHLFEVAVQGDQ